MIRRTPQEIADFFGCYVAQDDERNWWIYENKPVLDGDCWLTGGKSDEITRYLVETPEDHVWTKIYSPNVSENLTSSTVSEMEKVAGISKKETTREDSAEIAQAKDHYVIAYGDCIAGLTVSVNAYLADGYKLYGNLVIDNGEFYQSMIKYN